MQEHLECYNSVYKVTNSIDERWILDILKRGPLNSEEVGRLAMESNRSAKKAYQLLRIMNDKGQILIDPSFKWSISNAST